MTLGAEKEAEQSRGALGTLPVTYLSNSHWLPVVFFNEGEPGRRCRLPASPAHVTPS